MSYITQQSLLTKAKVELAEVQKQLETTTELVFRLTRDQRLLTHALEDAERDQEDLDRRIEHLRKRIERYAPPTELPIDLHEASVVISESGIGEGYLTSYDTIVMTQIPRPPDDPLPVQDGVSD